MKLSEIIDRPVVIERTSANLFLDIGNVEVPVTVRLRLSPKPRVVIEFDLRSDEYDASNELRAKNDVNLRLNHGLVINALVGNEWTLGGGKLSGILIPRAQPITVHNENTEIEQCKFALINFPSTWGKQDIHCTKDGHDYVTQHFKLKASNWQVEITGVDSLMGIHYKIEREGGSAITHFGSAKRTDGQGFDSTQLVPLLEALHLFLSFARGSYCGLALVSGQETAGKTIWQQWGTYKVEPWKRPLPSWAPLSQSESLSLVFRSFWDCLNDAQWGETVTKVMNWYLRSNESDEAEVGIILTQAALESLTSKIVGNKPRGTPEGAWIASALQNMGIDENLPSECRELLTLQNQLNSDHGPHVLVELRNSLIHADNRLGNITSGAHWEAWNLGQWFIEMMLLKLFGYTGDYTNRLKREREVVPVPWATNKA